MIATSVPEAATGVIVDGWNYVVAAYAVTWAMLGGYAIRLFLLGGKR